MMDAASAATDSDSTVPAMKREDTAPTVASSSTVTDTDTDTDNPVLGRADSNIANSYADDMDLLQLAEQQVATERYLVAARLLRRVSDTSLLQPLHERILKMADQAQEVLDTLLQYPSDDSDDGDIDGDHWKKQGESHGHRDTAIHYKVDDQARLTCRIETPIEESMLVPILSVFNESELYATWMPSWRFPRVCVAQSLKLAEYGRGNQVIQVKVQMPRLICDRQVVQHAFAVDDIDANEVILVKVQSCPAGPFPYAPEQDHVDRNDFDNVDVNAEVNADGTEKEEGKEGNGKGLQIPGVTKGTTSIDLDAGIMIRSCPSDHPLLLAAAEKKKKSKKPAASSYPVGEKLLLLSITQYVDAHVTGVPTTLINFFTRTVIGTMWGSMLQVAQDVRDGKRPQHAEAIQAKGELYDWVNDRVQVMFHKMEQREEAAERAKAEEDKVEAENVEAENVEADKVERNVATEEVKKAENLDEGYYNNKVEEKQEDNEAEEKQTDEEVHEDQMDNDAEKKQTDEVLHKDQADNEGEDEQQDHQDEELDEGQEDQQMNEEVHEDQADNDAGKEQKDEELHEDQAGNAVADEQQDEESNEGQEDHDDQVDHEVEAIEKDEKLEENLEEDPDEELDEDPGEELDEGLDEDLDEGLDKDLDEDQEDNTADEEADEKDNAGEANEESTHEGEDEKA